MELIKVSSMVLNGADVNSVNSRDIYEYLGLAKGQYSRWIKSAVEKYDFIEGEDFVCFDMSVEGTIARTYFVTIDVAKELCMVSDSNKGKEVRKYFIECEKKLKQPIQMLSRKELALMVIEQEEKIEELERTKAYISDKKTATALNTASQAVKQVNKLQIELDKSKEYCTIKRMSMLTHGQNYSFKALREASNEMGISSIDIFDANYGTVKAYHRNVWLEVYGLEF